jgi:hypothetical protein
LFPTIPNFEGFLRNPNAGIDEKKSKSHRECETGPELDQKNFPSGETCEIPVIEETLYCAVCRDSR